MSATTLIEVDNLAVEFPTERGIVRAVDGVSFSIPRGEIVALVGPSGSGKTVTALGLLRLVSPPGRIAGGKVLHDAGDLLRVSDESLRQVRGRRIAAIFQDPLTALHPAMRIGDQVAEVLRVHSQVSAREARGRAIEFLALAGMTRARARASEHPHELSSGLRQRATVALALVGDPELLIADEPTTALDATLQAEVLGLLSRLRRERGLSTLLITHDLAAVAQLADQALVMTGGRIVERGKPAELLRQPQHPITVQLVAAVRALEQDAAPIVSPAGPPLLEVEAVTKRFRTGAASVTAVEDVSLGIAEGETLALVGESGSGKTTLARLALGLLPPASGSVRFRGRNLASLAGAAFRELRKELQIIFSDPAGAFDPRQRIGDAIAEPLAVHRLGTAEQKQRRVLELLEQVGLDASLTRRFPHQLSGGQRQRAAIARALITKPRLIVADEPLSAVDVILQAQIVELFATLQRTFGIAFLLIAHDLRVVRRLARRVAVMQAGRIVELSAAADLYRNPRHPCTAALLAAMPRL